MSGSLNSLFYPASDATSIGRQTNYLLSDSAPVPFAPAPPLADAWDATSTAASDYLSRQNSLYEAQHKLETAQGYFDPATGSRTWSGWSKLVGDAGSAYANALLAGSMAPGGKLPGKVLPFETTALGRAAAADVVPAAAVAVPAAAAPVISQDALHAAIAEGQPGLHPDQVRQIGRHISDGVADEGGAAQARDAYHPPVGFEAGWHAGLDHLDEQHVAGSGDPAVPAPGASVESTAAPAPPPPPPGFRVYHGSGADHNRFSDEFIGTGEGAQAYGHGHYTADAEGVARDYRDALATTTFAPEPGAPAFNHKDFAEHLADMVHDTHDLTEQQLGYVPFATRTVTGKMAVGKTVPEIRSWVDSVVPASDTRAAMHAVLDNAEGVHVNPGWRSVGGEAFDDQNPVHVASDQLHQAGGDSALALSRLEAKRKLQKNHILSYADTHGQFAAENAAFRDKIAAKTEGAIAALKAGDVPPLKMPGHMYEIRVHADPEHFLDWDKPLSEQSAHVKAALETLNVKTAGEWRSGGGGEFNYHGPRGAEGNVRPYNRGTGDGPEWLASYDTLDNGRGSQRFKTQAEAQQWIEKEAPIETGRGASVYQQIVRENRSDYVGTRKATESEAAAKASRALKAAGIPGIRYLDASSRRVPAAEAELKAADAHVADMRSALAGHEAAMAAAKPGTAKHNAALLEVINHKSHVETFSGVADRLRAALPKATRNTVVFDPATMEIIRKYGIAGLLAGGGAAAATGEKSQ